MSDNFVIEAWTYLAIDIVVVGFRSVARWRLQGFRGLAVDDFLMVIAILLYTAETATAYYVGAYWDGLANSGMTDAERAALDQHSHEYHLRVKGSQTQLFGWLVYTVLLWTLKLSWLFFYKRLGDGVNNMSRRINIGFAFVGVTFFVTFFTILCGCWPIRKHWQINPDPGNFCQPAVSRLQAWTLICTNLTTDFYIMTIPMPMVMKAYISKIKKTGLIVMFCGGLITAVFGGLRCGYVLQDSIAGPQLAGEWSCRESFVAVFVSNFPVLFPIVHRSIRKKNGTSGDGSKGQSGRAGANSSGKGYKLSTLSSSSRNQQKKQKKFQHPLSLPGDTFYDRCGSEEEIISEERDRKEPSVEDSTVPAAVEPRDNIRVTTEWRVQSKSTNPQGRQQESRRAVLGGFQQ